MLNTRRQAGNPYSLLEYFNSRLPFLHLFGRGSRASSSLHGFPWLIFTLRDIVVPVEPKPLEFLTIAVWPYHRDSLYFLQSSESEDQSTITGRGVARAALGKARLFSSTRFQNDTSAHNVGVVLTGQLDSKPVIFFRQRYFEELPLVRSYDLWQSPHGHCFRNR